MVLLLVFIELFELGRDLIRRASTLLTNLHLLSLVHCIEVVLYLVFLVNVLAHNSLLFLFLFPLLLLDLILQISLVLILLHFFDLLGIYGRVSRGGIPGLSGCDKVTKLVP